jgi:ubiquitin C-terminal hydrolase
MALLALREPRQDEIPPPERRTIAYATADKLVGIGLLWRAFLEARQPAIALRAMLFLNTLYQNVTIDSVKQSKLCRLRDAHVQLCVSYLFDAVGKLNGGGGGGVKLAPPKPTKKSGGGSSSDDLLAYAADAERVVERCLQMLTQLLDGFAELDVLRKMEPGQALAPQQQLKVTVRLDNGRLFTLIVAPSDSVKLLRQKLTQEYSAGGETEIRIMAGRRELLAADDSKAVAECDVVDGCTLFVAAGSGGAVEEGSDGGGVIDALRKARGKKESPAAPTVAPAPTARTSPPSLLGAMGNAVAMEPLTTMSLRPPKPTASLASAATATNNNNNNNNNSSNSGSADVRLRSVDDFPKGWPNVTLATPATFALLFELLQRDGIAEHVFRLLDQLPSSESMLEPLRKLSSGWQAQFDGAHPHRQLYAARLVVHLIEVSRAHEAIIDDMEHVNDNSAAVAAVDPSSSWADQLVAAGGLELFASCLVDADLMRAGAFLRALDLLTLESGGGGGGFVRKRFATQLASLPITLLSLVRQAAECATAAAGRGVARHAMRLLQALCESGGGDGVLCAWSGWDAWLSASLIGAGDVRQEAASGLAQLCQGRAALASVLRGKLLAMLPLATASEHRATCGAFYTALRAVLSSDEALFGEFAERLRGGGACIERMATGDAVVDAALVGLLECTRALVVDEHAAAPALARLLFDEYLFALPTAQNALHDDAPPRCKSAASRAAAFELLHAVAARSAAARGVVVALLGEKLAALARTLETSWSHSHTRQQKSATGYVGLQNQGATCYMNSVVQQLFGVPQLRERLARIEVGETRASDSRAVLEQLQVLFANLSESLRRAYDTIDFCRTLKDYDGQPINVGQQMDANDFFFMLFDKLDEQLRGTAHADTLRGVFGGELSNQLISNECGHRSERAEPFYSLGLEIKNKSNILQSFELFVEGEMLAGDNAYFCGTCQQRRDTLKRVCLKTLPNVLVVNMKRFEYNVEMQQNKKLNDCCAFPMTLDVADYTVEGVANKALPEDERTMRDADYYQYELVGIVVHQGSSDSGHYYSFVRERQPPPGVKRAAAAAAAPCWFEFNDTSVSPFLIEDIPDECFGGTVEVMRNGETFLREKGNNAYILFYERKKWIDWPAAAEEALRSAENTPRRDSLMRERIWRENQQYLTERFVFSDQFFGFLWRLSEVHEARELTLLFLFRVLARSVESAQQMPHWIARVRSGEWLLQWFAGAGRQLLVDLLWECPHDAPRAGVVQLIVAGWKETAAELSDDGGGDALVDFLLSLLGDLRHNPRAVRFYFALLLQFAQLSARHRRLLLKRGVVGKICDVYHGERAFAAPFDADAEERAYAEAIGNGAVRAPRPPYVKPVANARWPVGAHWSDAAELVAALLCSAPPDELPPGARRVALRTALLDTWLHNAINVDACVRALLHWCGARAASLRAIERCAAGLADAARPAHCEPYLRLLHALVALPDALRWWRAELALAAYARALAAHAGQRPMLACLAEWLIVAVAQSPRVVRRWAAQNADLLNDLLAESGYSIKV